MHYEAHALFYFLAFCANLIFIGGIAGLVYVWRLGKEPSLNTGITLKDWFGYLVRAVFLQKQIRDNGTYPWVAHLLIFYGFISLLLLTTLQFILTWFVSSDSWSVAFFKDGAGSSMMALWGDFWGLALFAGIVMALVRRYILKPKAVDTISEDAIAIWLLFAVVVTGFFCEAVRLAARPEAHDAAYSFVVGWLVPMLRGMGFGEGWTWFMFWVHGLLSLGFIAYIPFGKLNHVFASPLTYAFVSSGEQYTKT